MGLLKTPKYAQDNLEKVETKLKEYIQEHSRVTAPPTTVFDHQGPDGTWTPFRAEDCLKIKKAMDKNDDGVVKLDGVPFEVRWGSKATSKKMPTRPDTDMIQVNIKNDNTRIVRHREERVSEFDWHKPSRVYVTFETEAGMEDMCVEVRPRWPIGPRDRRSTTQQAQLSKRKQPRQESTSASESDAKRGKTAEDATV